MSHNIISVTISYHSPCALWNIIIYPNPVASGRGLVRPQIHSTVAPLFNCIYKSMYAFMCMCVCVKGESINIIRVGLYDVQYIYQQKIALGLYYK